MKEKTKKTNLERYGAENVGAKESSLYEEIQEKLEGKRPVFRGDDNAFAKPEVQEKIRETMMERYGVEIPQQSPEIRAKTRETKDSSLPMSSKPFSCG
ncbi:MAG: hypothetical protein GF334_05320 [Candidatus Altiarchaeales archaeon]|nr:hypothetical protein [Candidatus Altiarchaeales archaeon]